MIPYISKVNNNKDYLTSGLLLEELNVKEFDKSNKVMINNNDGHIIILEHYSEL